MNRALGDAATRPTTDWKALADSHAETLRAVLLDLGFHRRDAVTDAVVDKCMKALSRHREVAS